MISFLQLHPDHSLFDQGVKTDGTVQLSVQLVTKPGMCIHICPTCPCSYAKREWGIFTKYDVVFKSLVGEEKLNILEIVKPVETVEVVIDPDAAAGEEAHLVEDGQVIAVERAAIADETSEQVTRWAAALEGYRKEQVRLSIPYGKCQVHNSIFYCMISPSHQNACKIVNCNVLGDKKSEQNKNNHYM